MSRPNVYPAELRQRAVRMVAEMRPNYESEYAAITAVAQKLGIGTAETLRKWIRQAQVDGGARPGVTTEESAEIKRLRREVAELRRANEILKAASVFWLNEVRGGLLTRSEHPEWAPDVKVPVALSDHLVVEASRSQVKSHGHGRCYDPAAGSRRPGRHRGRRRAAWPGR